MSLSAQQQAELLDQYAKSRGVYSDFTATLSLLINTLLTSSGLQVHTITHRCKDAASLAGKLSRPEKTYEALSDITDLAGLRITTYFSSDVDRVAEILEREFRVDPHASVDKRKYADPDRFGYSSLHYIAELFPARTQLPEYSRFHGLKCEIQVRSILQHAWAEIEHDLGYKSAAGVPTEVRRRFARVASLLELADDEFGQIRVTLKNYEASVASKISKSPATVSLDLASFRALYEFASNVAQLDRLVIKSGGGHLDSEDNPRADTLVERLQSFGITNIEQLERIAGQNANSVSAFVRYWVDDDLGAVSRGIGVFYLLYVLAAETKDKALINNYLETYKIGVDEERPGLADRIYEFESNERAA